MINIKVDTITKTKIECTCEVRVKGEHNAINEFNAVLNSLDKADHRIFAFALLKFIDEHVESEGEDE